MDTSLTETALGELTANALQTFSPAARAVKESGGRIVGLLYNYVPEEILTAAGLLSYRLRALNSTQTVLAESRFTEINCSLVRHFYDSAARGDYEFLDGLASTNSCDHERRLFDNWVAKLPMPHGFFLTYPKKQGPEQVERFAAELEGFRRALENAYALEITDAALSAAIELHNETRALQRDLYELMKLDRPPLTGAQVLTVMMAATTMPKADYNDLVRRLLADCAVASGQAEHQVRLLLYGGEIDSVPLLELIEGEGALVTGDSLGYGYRSCAVDVTQTGEPLLDLARWMVAERPSEPRVFGTATARQDFVRDTMREFRADGVVVTHLPMCDFWGFEKHNFDAYADSRHIPVLSLNVDYIVANTGQLRTRVQAFIETLT